MDPRHPAGPLCLEVHHLAYLVPAAELVGALAIFRRDGLVRVAAGGFVVFGALRPCRPVTGGERMTRVHQGDLPGRDAAGDSHAGGRR